MKLFLCEKPSQAREIAPHLGVVKRGDGCITGNDTVVTWAIGHLVELAKPEHYEPALKSWDIDLLPVLLRTWVLVPQDRTKDQYRTVVRLLKQADEVVIATDADREGEVIARELMQMAKYTGKVSRLWLSAFDDASIRKALGKLLPGGRTLPMYFSGMGRSHADWLAGMNLTMALTKAFGTGGKEGTLHCGRVQTPVLALIVRRERAIACFRPVTHYQLSSVFELGGQPVSMTWLPNESLLDKDGLATDRARVEVVAKKVSGRTGCVESVETVEERELAPLPYSLGSLQREASARFGMKAKAVLDAAQALYEKHKATTYPRTDCEYLPSSMMAETGAVLDAIQSGNPELRESVDHARRSIAGSFSGRAFNDGKITAHHAIIPTQHPGVDRSSMTKDEKTVYDMMCRRSLSQFLGSHLYLKTTILVVCENEWFRVPGKIPRVLGWRALEPERASKPDAGEDADPESGPLPDVLRDDAAHNLKCEVATRKTSPPKRYTEGTLLAAMESIDKEIEDPRWKAVMKNKEKAGIGTDATRAAIIEGLFKQDYIVARKKDLLPTDKDDALIGLIEKVAPEIADPVLTAQWEDRLGQIEKGEIELSQFEQSLGQWLEQVIDGIRGQAGSMCLSVKPDGKDTKNDAHFVACPACGKPMRRLKGSKSYFWGCTAYQEGCRATLPDLDGKPGARSTASVAGDSTGPHYPCPKCQMPLRRVNGPRGPFWGCTGYPECRHTQPDDAGKPGVRPDDVQGTSARRERPPAREPAGTAKAGESCPACNKGLLVAKTLQGSGRAFVGCNRFPECRYFAWPTK